MSANRLHITVVCTGNICRSPMGDVILNHAINQAGLTDQVRVDSCGTGGWHVGSGADPRAIAELISAGYDGTKHRAAQFDQHFAAADLLIAMDSSHVASLQRYGVSASRVRLLRSFDPAATHDLNVADPYYGYPEDFTTARKQVEAAIPGIMAWVYQELNQ